MSRPRNAATAAPAALRCSVAVLFAAGLAVPSLPAAAQFDAGRQANLMHQHELMRQQTTRNGTDEPAETGPEEPAQAERRAAARNSPVVVPGRSAKLVSVARMEAELARMMERHLLELGPEYERRRQRHGRERANAWLGGMAAEAGRRDGEAVRARLGH